MCSFQKIVARVRSGQWRFGIGLFSLFIALLISFIVKLLVRAFIAVAAIMNRDLCSEVRSLRYSISFHSYSSVKIVESFVFSIKECLISCSSQESVLGSGGKFCITNLPVALLLRSCLPFCYYMLIVYVDTL